MTINNAGHAFPVRGLILILICCPAVSCELRSCASAEIPGSVVCCGGGSSTSGAGVDDEAVGYYLMYRFRNRLWKSERMVSLMKRFCAAAISVVSEDGIAKGHSQRASRNNPFPPLRSTHFLLRLPASLVLKDRIICPAPLDCGGGHAFVTSHLRARRARKSETIP